MLWHNATARSTSHAVCYAAWKRSTTVCAPGHRRLAPRENGEDKDHALKRLDRKANRKSITRTRCFIMSCEPSSCSIASLTSRMLDSSWCRVLSPSGKGCESKLHEQWNPYALRQRFTPALHDVFLQPQFFCSWLMYIFYLYCLIEPKVSITELLSNAGKF